MQEREDQSDVCIFLGCGHQIEIVVLDVHEGNIAMEDDGSQIAILFLLHHQGHELVNSRHINVSTVVPTYHDLLR